MKTDPEIQRLKHEVDLIRLIQDSGVTLRKVGTEMKGLCLFHLDEHHPSLSASPSRQLFRCFTCGAAGDCFSWVMLRDHVGFARAKAILIAYLGGRLSAPPTATTRSSISARVAAAPSLVRDARDEELLHLAIRDYNAQLHRSSQALSYLASRGLGDVELLDRFLVGFAGPHLCVGPKVAGEDLRARPRCSRASGWTATAWSCRAAWT